MCICVYILVSLFVLSNWINLLLSNFTKSRLSSREVGQSCQNFSGKRITLQISTWYQSIIKGVSFLDPNIQTLLKLIQTIIIAIRSVDLYWFESYQCYTSSWHKIKFSADKIILTCWLLNHRYQINHHLICYQYTIIIFQNWSWFIRQNYCFRIEAHKYLHVCCKLYDKIHS